MTLFVAFGSFNKATDLQAKRTSVQAPWQNGIAERWVGNCRREILDHVIALNESQLRRLTRDYLINYHDDRIHDSLETTRRPSPSVWLVRSCVASLGLPTRNSSLKPESIRGAGSAMDLSNCRRKAERRMRTSCRSLRFLAKFSIRKCLKQSVSYCCQRGSLRNFRPKKIENRISATQISSRSQLDPRLSKSIALL
jgi:hypothetical protein